MTKLLIRILSLVVAAAVPSTAAAVICSNRPPLCQGYQDYEAIFDGTVISIERLDLPSDHAYASDGRMGHRLVTFRVHDAWKGVDSGTVQMLFWGGFGVWSSESFSVSMYQRYLIFANRGFAGYLSTSSCSDSVSHANAAESLEFLNSLRRPPAGARVYGNVWKYQPQEWMGHAGVVAHETRLTLISGEVTHEIHTEQGRFDLKGLPPGDYLLTASPAAPLAGESIRRFTLESPRSCAKVDFSFSFETVVSGRLVSTGGTEIPNREVNIVSADRWHEWPLPFIHTSTDRDGTFSFSGLEPGRYIVGVNLRDVLDDFQQFPRTMYGGEDPDIITVRAGDRHDLGTLIVKRSLQKAEFSARLTWDDGRPAGQVDVRVEDATGGWVDGQDRTVTVATTDRRGAFTFTGREHRHYVVAIRATPSDPNSVVTRSEPFSSAEGPSIHTIVLPQPKR